MLRCGMRFESQGTNMLHPRNSEKQISTEQAKDSGQRKNDA